MSRFGTPYGIKRGPALGADYFDRLDADRIVKSHVRRLKRLGDKVSLAACEQAA